MSQVFITQTIDPQTLQQLDQAGISYRYRDETTPLPTDDLVQTVAEADVEGIVCLLTDQIGAQLMDAAPRLKVIANVAVGYDNINLAAATERGIVVTNTPDVLTETTADLAFALLLALARKVVAADAHMRAGKYQKFQLFPPNLGVDVYGKTLGIVGMGRIGTAVARRGALGFDMPVLYTARSDKKTAERELGARHVSFAQLLQESDFVSINAPLTPETHHMFTLEAFRQMKPTACLINTARGPLVKEADLVQALEQGLIGGAALDVFEEEPKMHPGLAKFRDNLIVTPHIGSASVATRQQMARMAVANVIAALTNEQPPHMLNPEAWTA